jgi:hypothetical protein
MIRDILYSPIARPDATGSAGCEIIVRQNQALSFTYGRSVFMYEKKRQVIKAQFEQYKDEWEMITAFSSSINEIVNNNPYRSIIGLGKDVVPFIISDLAKTQNYWFHALTKITGENPIPKEHSGDINSMVKDWLGWAEKNAIC